MTYWAAYSRRSALGNNRLAVTLCADLPQTFHARVSRYAVAAAASAIAKISDALALTAQSAPRVENAASVMRAPR
jgi:hypothetical protein